MVQDSVLQRRKKEKKKHGPEAGRETGSRPLYPVRGKAESTMRTQIAEWSGGGC